MDSASDNSSAPPALALSALHPETLAVTVGRPDKVVDAPLNQPPVFASTYVGAYDAGQGEMGYGRYANPTWAALEQAIGALEGGRALTFATGMAAAHAVLELLPPAGTIVIPGNCYLGVATACDERAQRYGLTVRRVDVADTSAVLAAAEGADMVWIESPTNPTIEIADLPAIGAALGESRNIQATRRGRSLPALFVVDNTFATPLLQRPLDSGADIVLHSATKFLSGHSDALMGALVVRDDSPSTGADNRSSGDDKPAPGDDTPSLVGDLWSRLHATRSLHGATPGTLEAYLVLRGLRTLAVRLERAQSTAAVLSDRLAAHPAVRRVRFPGLPHDPGHEVAARTMSGFGSLLSIDLADADAADSVISGARIWVFATSLGGVESTFERRRRWPGELSSVPEGLIRLSVGLEHVEDLWADLEQALDRLG